MRRVPVVLLAAAALFALAAPASAAIPAHTKWHSSDPFGAWNNGGFIVYNNEWNHSAGPQTIWADSFSHWGVESKQAAGNTAVETYPCVQKNFSDVPVRSFGLIRSGFTESMPAQTAGLDAEAANDVWLNKYHLEVMIWVDNHGQRPSGNIVGHAVIYGQRFAVWRGGTDFTFALDHAETSGVTHILASIDWLIAHRYIPATVTVAQVNFGWEIASTDGKAEDFTVTKFWLHSKRSA